MIVQSKVGSVLLIVFAVIGALAIMALLGMAGMMGMMGAEMGEACRGMMTDYGAPAISS
jgi:hypothetical protein